ncbi:5902_t:CDS:2 [Acaulospora morrowiae]|uniref:5902_t:CDS:1 n=1 Tax=Acaulospora morrowiae TaxID=94023 RepID=A0A9N9CQU1_9GLOM|nr:5902_t:CDS:2 [Acaulospora morrowiae]
MSDWLNFLGWTFLPNLATSFIQTFCYKIAHCVGVKYPKPGQPRHATHYRWIYTFVVLAYLVYTIVNVIYSIQPNYYAALNIDQDFSAKEIKNNFRKLQLLFHPDKNQDEAALANFIALRVAYETLMDPTKRFAYDRFGPEIENCNNCLTIRDYLAHGWSSFIGFYLGVGLVLFILNILGKGQFGRFWRFVVFFGVACIESLIILHPDTLAIIPFGLSRWVIFEQVTILRQLFITVFIAISQVGPVLFPAESIDERYLLRELESLSNAAIEDSKSMLRASFQPFREDPAAQVELRRKMEELVIDNFLCQNDPEFNQVYQRVIVNCKKTN